MGNMPKWVIILGTILVVFVVAASYLASNPAPKPLAEESPRAFSVPSPSPATLNSSDQLPQLTSASIEINGVFEAGCNAEYLSLAGDGIKYQFKVTDLTKTLFIGKTVTANILPSVTEETCGPAAKLGSVREKDRPGSIYVLGRKICLPATDPSRQGDCWIGIKSQAEDYYTVNSVPNNPKVKISDFDLILVSGNLDSTSKTVYPGQKGRIIISDTQLLTKDAYK